MPLIKCADCGKEISDSAIKCPYCGSTYTPIGKTAKTLTKAMGTFGMIINSIVFLFLMSITMFFNQSLSLFLLVVLVIIWVWWIKMLKKR